MKIKPIKYLQRPVLFFAALLWLGLCVEPGAKASGQDGYGGLAEALPDQGFLYFADARGEYLKAVAKRFPAGLDPHGLGRNILEALAAGPPNPGLTPTLPAGTTIRAVFLGEEGKAWVDLGVQEGKLKQEDTLSELLTLYSIVNSLAVNLPGVDQVKLLINGDDTKNLGGHISLGHFYKTNMLIVK